MKKISKFLIIFLTAAILSGSVFGFAIPPKTAEAIPVEEVGPVGYVIEVGIPIIASGVGVTGSGQGVVAAAKATLGTTCETILAALGAADTVESLTTLLDTSSSAAFNVIGGGAAEATKVSAKIVKAAAAKECIDAYILALDIERTSVGATLGLNGEIPVATEIDRYGKVSAALQQVIENLKAQQSASVKDILKAFMVKLVLNLNKNLTTSLVNNMVEKYKISDYLAYGDALTSQVYSMKYINDNFKGDARQQMIIRSLLQSEKLPGKVQTAQAFATSKAQDYLAAVCGLNSSNTANQDLSSYIKCLSAYGSADANPQYHYLQGIDQANAARSAGQLGTSQEISQSNGFAPPRNCKGSLTMQKQIDAQYDKAATDLRVATMARTSLENALKLSPPRTTQEEVQKAIDNEAQAKANEKALNSQVSSPIIDICEAIDTPASFVSTSIGDFLKQHLDQTSQLKSDNLPFYATFLANVTSNFLTNILTGGKSTSQVLKEAGTGALLSAGGIVGSLPSGGSSTLPQGKLDIYAYDPADSNAGRVTALVPGKKYVLVVYWVEFSNDNPYKVKLDYGEIGLPPVNRELTSSEIGNQRITVEYTAGNSPFTISTVLYAKSAAGAADKVLVSQTQNFTVSGQVQGVSTFLPRGPAITIR